MLYIQATIVRATHASMAALATMSDLVIDACAHQSSRVSIVKHVGAKEVYGVR